MSLLSDNYIIPVEKGTFYDATDTLFTNLFGNINPVVIIEILVVNS